MALTEARRSVPEEVAVTGFDDAQLARLLEPGLTTVHQPTRELGERCVELLLRRIEDPSASPARVVLPTTLIVRRSCGAPCSGKQGTAAPHEVLPPEAAGHVSGPPGADQARGAGAGVDGAYRPAPRRVARRPQGRGAHPGREEPFAAGAGRDRPGPDGTWRLGAWHRGEVDQLGWVRRGTANGHATSAAALWRAAATTALSGRPPAIQSAGLSPSSSGRLWRAQEATSTG